MRYASFLLVCGFGWAAAIACGGSDSNGTGGSSPCTQVCNCVGASDPNAKADCNTQCGSILSTTAPADRVSTCQSQLASRGFSSCDWTCSAAFGQSQTGSGGSNGGGSCSPSADVNPTLCISQGMPKKLKCSSTAAQNNALAAGCVKENSAATDDLNVCCSSGGGPGGATGAGGSQNQGGFTNTGGFVGTGAVVGAGGFIVEGPGGTFGSGGYVVIGPGGSFNAGGFGSGGYVGSAGSTGGGGRVTCDTGWLADCATIADCTCSLECVQSCSGCTPSCARPCKSDADCTGSGVGSGTFVYDTPHCYVTDPQFLGWCGS